MAPAGTHQSRKSIAAVFVGGLVGGLGRFEIGAHWTTVGYSLPWPTLAINTTGAFLLALVIVASERRFAHLSYLRPGLGAGLCGSFTTFSAVVTTADLQLAHAHLGTAIAYLVLSVVLGIGAVVAGLRLGRAVL